VAGSPEPSRASLASLGCRARQYLTVRSPAGADRRGALARLRVEASDGEEFLGVRSSAVADRASP
jgi:hypothetical protein